jgi:hypothetical protein
MSRSPTSAPEPSATSPPVSAGVSNVPNLDLGTYRVRISAKGFTTCERADLRLTANQIINIDANHLQLGAATQVVEVQGASPAISTETTDVAGMVGHDTLEDLPLVGRHDAGAGGIYTYVTYTTGAARIANSSTPIIQGTRSQIGILPTMDGIAVMAYPQGAGPVQPGIEDVQEVRIETASPLPSSPRPEISRPSRNPARILTTAAPSGSTTETTSTRAISSARPSPSGSTTISRPASAAPSRRTSYSFNFCTTINRCKQTKAASA